MKENKIEKLILNLSTRWDCSPQEAVDRLNSMNESEINKLINSMTKKFQIGGSIASRIWNRIKGADTYVDGYGMARNHVPVRESAWRTTKTFANSPLAQAIPVVGDIADGVNAVDYATKGDYLPAAMAVGMGLLTPNSAEVVYKMVDGDDYAARVIRERQQKAAKETAERQAIAKSSKDQYKKSARGRFSKESLDYDNPHISNIPNNRDYSDLLDQNAHSLFTGQDYVDMHKNGGFMNCLRNGGSISKCKCGDRIAKGATGMEMDNKKSRVDAKGSAYTYPDGTDVLTRDAVGSQPMPGSYYSIPGSTPEYETHRRRKTNKGGDVEFDLYNVYLNDGDHFGPIARYTTRRSWRNPRTWFRILLSPKKAQEMQAAYDINGLKQGGELPQLPKKKKNYLKK